MVSIGRLSISPCPNDTFLFEAMVKQVTESGGQVDFLDIAELNRLASLEDGPDVIKVSCANAPAFLSHYRLLRCGGAFADAVGPLVLRRPGSIPDSKGVASCVLPGWRTSAHILWRKWLRACDYPQGAEAFMRFDQIPELVAHGEYQRGVVIHESRFVYKDYGLEEEVDLGRFWDEITKTPVPLGCVLVRKDRGLEFAEQIARFLVDGARNAFLRADPLTPFISSHAAEMSPEVQRQHIRTYVTQRSLDCDSDGLEALRLLWNEAEKIEPWTIDARQRDQALEDAVSGCE